MKKEEPHPSIEENLLSWPIQEAVRKFWGRLDYSKGLLSTQICTDCVLKWVCILMSWKFWNYVC